MARHTASRYWAGKNKIKKKKKKAKKTKQTKITKNCSGIESMLFAE